jgi:CO/xanthine dehydrogenase Mo-binding subunit
VLVNSVAYRSHTPPNGAFRGFGVPQTCFAIESHIDRLARACGQEPHTFRYNNRLKLGDTTGTGQVLRESVGTREVLDEALAASDFERKLRERGGARIQPGDRLARGVGLAFYWHGAGFTGGGEAKIAARVALDLADDGLAHVRVAQTEMGQGSHTVLAQIVAEEAGLPLSAVGVDPPDTALVPNSGPTVASRTTMIVGGELARCARDARARLLAAAAAQTGRPLESLSLSDGTVLDGGEPLGPFSTFLARALADGDLQRWTFESQHQLAPHLTWDEPSHRGDAYACYAWGCTVAEVEVDLSTYEVRVPRVTVVVDIGRAVNPVLARGQVEGGTLQALGYALSEEVGVRPDGGLLRDRFQTYILPTTLDAPKIDARLVEVPYSRGPGGAKGLGEMPMNGGAPAVANAIEHALGVRITDLPLSPEKIYAAMTKERTP